MDDYQKKRPLINECEASSSNNHKRPRRKDDGVDKDHRDYPVHVITIDYNGNDDEDLSTSPPPSIPLSPTLEELIYPMTSDEFLSTIFRKKALHVTCSYQRQQSDETSSNRSQQNKHATIRVAKLCKEMYHLDAQKLFQETSSEQIFLWLQKNNPQKESSDDGYDSTKQKREPPRKEIQSIEISDPETAYTLHTYGNHSSYCRAPPHVEQNLVASLLRETGLGCGQYDPSGESQTVMARGEVETFISCHQGQLTNWHYDFQENFTIQLSGVEKWTIQQGMVGDPLRGCTPHYARQPGIVESQLKAAHIFDPNFEFGFPQPGKTAKGPQVDVVLQPGDVLYFPAGMWHKVEVIEPGVSINVSLMAQNYATVTSHALTQLLMTSNNKGWTEPIMNNSHTNCIDQLKKLLQDLPGIIEQFETSNNHDNSANESSPSSNGHHYQRNFNNDNALARFIIPPIVEYPPSFQAVEEEEDTNVAVDDDGWEEEEKDDGDNETTDDDVMTNARTINDGDVVVNGDENDIDDDDETNSVIDPKEFDRYPSDWHTDAIENLRVGDRVSFVRNPLGALHKLSEITSFYQSSETKKESREGHDSDKDAENKGSSKYVLNINYAGNEMHQSVIRVVLKDNNTELVKSLYEFERAEPDDDDENQRRLQIPNLFRRTVEEEDLMHIKFLIFHGYLQIVGE